MSPNRDDVKLGVIFLDKYGSFLDIPGLGKKQWNKTWYCIQISKVISDYPIVLIGKELYWISSEALNIPANEETRLAWLTEVKSRTNKEIIYIYDNDQPTNEETPTE